MSCVDCGNAGGCGTGGSNLPKPGDPDNNSILSATPAFGGIDVTWTLPLTNPFAVAYTKVLRSPVENAVSAIEITAEGGSHYYDKLDTDTRYYYWIQIVSVNGTVGDLIGPASAVAMPAIDQVIANLTAKIDAGHLSQALKSQLDQIALLGQAITQESQARSDSETATSTLLTQVQAAVDNATALLNQEITARTTSDSSLVQSIQTAQSTLGDNLAQVQTSLQTNIDTVGDTVTDIGALYTAQVNVNGLVGGFGVYNDGTSVEAGFDVDTFWIGKTADNKRKPFIIVNGVTYIDDAVIRQLTFDKLKAADGSLIVSGGKVQANYLTVNNAQSDNYLANTRGWSLKADGSGEVQGLKVRGDVEAATLKANTVMVNTIHVAGNAITIPVSSYSGAQTQLGAGNSDCLGCIITSTGAPITISVSVQTYPIGYLSSAPDGEGGTVITTVAYQPIIRIYRNNAAVLYTTQINSAGFSWASFAATISDQPGAGVQRYDIYIEYPGAPAGYAWNNNGIMWNPSIVLLETKR
jgi:hypothetical protein